MSKSTRSKRSSASRSGTPPPPASRRPGGAALLLAGIGTAAVALGVFSRLHALGRWPVSYDEFLMGKSVRSILATGLPGLAEGGYYVRGILLQYAAAAARLAGLGEESSLRIVPALLNLAGMPAVYLLARRLSGRAAGWIAVVAYALSATEIEFSRFGRMYAPFQALFAWFAYSLLRLVADRKRGHRLPLYVLAVAGIFVHESSVFLAILLFLPLALEGREARARDMAISFVILALAFYVNALDFRGAGASAGGAAAAGGVLARGLRKVRVPVLLVGSVASHGAWAVAAAILACVCAAAIFLALRDGTLSWRSKGLLSACAALAFLNLFAALTLLAVLGLLSGWFGWRDLRSRGAGGPLIAVAAAAAVWGARVLLSPAAPAPRGAFGFPLLSWPPIAEFVLVPWVEVFPVFCAVTGALLTLALIERIRMAREEPDAARITGMLLLLAVALVAVARTPYASTRYSVFLLPLVLVADVCVLRGLSRRLVPSSRGAAVAFLALCVAFLLLSEDLRPSRLFRTASLETNFRLADTWPEVNHFIPRTDYRTPAEFIRANRTAGDTVISVALPLEFYLDRPLDVFYLPREDPEFRNQAGTRSGRERFTGAEVVSDEESLLRRVDASPGTVWLVFGSETYPYKRAVSRQVAARYGPFRRFRGVDGRLDVYRVDGGRARRAFIPPGIPDSPASQGGRAPTSSPTGAGPPREAR